MKGGSPIRGAPNKGGGPKLGWVPQIKGWGPKLKGVPKAGCGTLN